MRLQQKYQILLVVALICILSIVLIGFGLSMFLRSPHTGQLVAQKFIVDGLDPHALNGPLPTSPRNEKSPGENIFSYRINSTPEFDPNGKNGNILVENPHFNEYLLVLELKLENDETVCYQSQYIAPNQYLEKIDLNRQIQSGVHKATAYINVIDPQTLDLVQIIETPIVMKVRQ